MSPKNKNIRIGLVARADNSGLGVLSYDFYKHLPIHKTLVVTSQFEQMFERYDTRKDACICERGIPSNEEISEFLDDLDVVICIETPYNWNILKQAQEKGVKTALVVMYEWTPNEYDIPLNFDLYICPTQLDYDTLWGNKILLPSPTDRKRAPFKKRTTAKTFIFNNGHGGVGGRNSINEFLMATQFVESDVKFIVRSQVPFEMPYNDTRIETKLGELPPGELWGKGDVYIHAHKFDGLSLPLQEALSAGYPVIAVDREPYNAILPQQLLFEAGGTGKVKLQYRKVDAVAINPKILGEKIDEVARMRDEEIEKLSERSNELAEDFSWEKLAPRYMEELTKLVNGK